MKINKQSSNMLFSLLFVMAAILYSDGVIPDACAMDDMPGGMGLHHSTFSGPGEPLPPYSARVIDFHLDGGSVSGEVVTFFVEIGTSGAGARTVPWVIYGRDRVNGTMNAIAVKSAPDVPAGTSFTDRVAWKALPGIFEFFAYVDPQQSLGEAVEEQQDNRSKTELRQFSDWQGWADAFSPGLQASMNTWIAEAVIDGYRTLPDKLFFPGTASTLLPDYIDTAVKNSVSDAWIKWAKSVEIPVAVTAEPVALDSLVQTASFLEPAQLANSIKSQVGPVSDWPGGEAAIEKVSESFYRMFNEWRLRAFVLPDGKGKYKLDTIGGKQKL